MSAHVEHVRVWQILQAKENQTLVSSGLTVFDLACLSPPHFREESISVLIYQETGDSTFNWLNSPESSLHFQLAKFARK